MTGGVAGDDGQKERVVEVPTNLLFLVSSARGFLGMGNGLVRSREGPRAQGTGSPVPCHRRAYLFAICAVLALGACGIGDSPEFVPFTITWSVAAGDLNGDGRPDLASANTFIAGPPPHPGHVSVILQSQSSPGAFDSAMNLDAGSDTVGLSIGDLNGDNLMDLVAANYYSARISILFQNSSSPGTFLAAQNLGVGVYPNEVAVGDLNGDGYLDIAVADSGQAIGGSLFFQNAGAPGTFFPRISLGVHCNSVGIGDLNEDGRADLVCTGTDTGNVSILLQSPAGAGTLLPPQTLAAGVQPSNIAIADLNADGPPRPCDCESWLWRFRQSTFRHRFRPPEQFSLSGKFFNCDQLRYGIRVLVRRRWRSQRRWEGGLSSGEQGLPRRHSRECVSIFPEPRHARSLSSRSESARDEWTYRCGYCRSERGQPP